MDNEKTKKPGQEKTSEDPDGCHEEAKKSVMKLKWPFASESGPTARVTPNIEMMYLHKADEKVAKYLELVDDVMIVTARYLVTD